MKFLRRKRDRVPTQVTAVSTIPSGQLWLPNGPTFHVVSTQVGSGQLQALTLNPWQVPPNLLASYVAAVKAGMPEPVSQLDAARVAWSPFSTWPGDNAWPEGIAGSPYEFDADCYLGVNTYRQHVALLLQVTGWDVDRLVAEVSMSNGGAALFALLPANERTN